MQLSEGMVDDRQPGGSSGSDERIGCRKRQGRTREGAALLAGAAAHAAAPGAVRTVRTAALLEVVAGRGIDGNVVCVLGALVTYADLS